MVQTYKCAKCGKAHTVKVMTSPGEEPEFETPGEARAEMQRFVRLRGIEEEDA